MTRLLGVKFRVFGKYKKNAYNSYSPFQTDPKFTSQP